MKASLTLVPLALASLAACGGSNLCDTAQSAWNRFNSGSAPCGISPLVFNRQTCDQSLGSCSDADKSTIESYFNCLDKVPACTSSTQDTWTAQVQACGNPTVSNQACADAVNAQ